MSDKGTYNFQKMNYRNEKMWGQRERCPKYLFDNCYLRWIGHGSGCALLAENAVLEGDGSGLINGARLFGFGDGVNGGVAHHANAENRRNDGFEPRACRHITTYTKC